MSFFPISDSRAKKLLIIEIIVGVLILIAGVFLITYEGMAPTISPSATMIPENSMYISSPLQITLSYPYGWKIDPAFNGIPGIERYIGKNGFFEVGATNDPTPMKGVVIKKYPKPIKLGVTTYKYFTLKVDEAHLKTIGDSVKFI